MRLDLLARFVQALEQLSEHDQNEALIEGARLVKEFHQEHSQQSFFESDTAKAETGTQPRTEAQQLPEPIRPSMEPGTDLEDTLAHILPPPQSRMSLPYNSMPDEALRPGTVPELAGDEDKKKLIRAVEELTKW